MTRRTVLAAVDDSTAAAPVLEVSAAVAVSLDATLEPLHVSEDGARTAQAVARRADVALREVGGDPTQEIVAAAADPNVVLVVVGARGQPSGPRPLGHVALRVLEQVLTPVLVVPPDVGGAAEPIAIRRALVPLEDAGTISADVADLLERFCAFGTEIVGLHVFDSRTTPAFWDAPGHAEQSWADAFLDRCGGTSLGVDLRLRRGSTPETVIDVAASEHVDLIVLSWSRDLSPGRAAVIRGTLTHAEVPVLLVPTGTTR